MSCRLMEHQKVCLTWLMRQEEDESKRGSLLADGMGLGKTIEALALILANPSQNPLRKTTLIVAPLAVLRQWQCEIVTKVKPGYLLTTLIFHGPSSRKMTINEVLQCDIVLCTYHKLAAEYKTAIEQKRPHAVVLLHRRARFYRVILDEAHNIKNKLAKWEGGMGDRALLKLQTLFRSITLRRTKESRLDGRPIIRQPARREPDAHTEFDEDQAAFYHALEHQQRLRVNKYLRAGTAMKNYIYILVLLLRLRQVCDHSHLIKNHGIPEGAKLGPDGMLALAVQLPEDVVERLEMMEGFECPVCEE